jgi:hypothetical protein
MTFGFDLIRSRACPYKMLQQLPEDLARGRSRRLAIASTQPHRLCWGAPAGLEGGLPIKPDRGVAQDGVAARAAPPTLTPAARSG